MSERFLREEAKIKEVEMSMDANVDLIQEQTHKIQVT